MQFFRYMMHTRKYRIVVGLDGSEYAEIVLEHAFDQAARHDSPDLHLVSIVGDERELDRTKQWLARIALEGLDAFGERASPWSTRLHVRVGKPEREIANIANEVDADLLVIGNYGVHRHRKSTATRIMERVACPTLVLGLSGHVVEVEPQCPACVLVRESTDGERWFCDAHTSDHELRLSTLVPRGAPLTHGGTMW